MVQMYGVAQREFCKKLPLGGEEIFSRQPCFWSHDFNFLHIPKVYGVARLLYSVVLSDSVYMQDSAD